MRVGTFQAGAYPAPALTHEFLASHRRHKQCLPHPSQAQPPLASQAPVDATVVPDDPGNVPT